MSRSPSARGAHVARWSRLCMSSVFVLLAACGGKEAPEPEASPSPVPAHDHVELRIAVDLPDTTMRAVERWAEERRARVEWIDPAAPAAANATLREIEGDELDALVAANGLHRFGDATTAMLTAFWFGSEGQRDANAWGLPWRATLHALGGESLPADWSELARAGARFALYEPGVTDTYLALAAAAGAFGDSTAFDPESEPSVEALAFFARLYARATRVLADGRQVRPDDADGAVSFSARAAVPGTAAMWGGLPGPTSDRSAVVLARPRLLVVPRGGDHPDLGEELARWLGDPLRAIDLLDADSILLPLRREVEGREAAERAVLALRAGAVVAPSRGVDARAWNELLTEAVRAAVERRRSPEAALADAVRRRAEGRAP